MKPEASPCTMAVLVIGWPGRIGARTTVPLTACSSLPAASCVMKDGSTDAVGHFSQRT